MSNSNSSNMTSPAWSDVSRTPSITITFDDERTARFEDMEKVELEEPSSTSDFTPVPTERPRSLTFDLPPSKPSSCPQTARPIPARAKTAVGTISTTENDASTVSGSPAQYLRPELQRSGSTFSFAGFLSSSPTLSAMVFGKKDNRAKSPPRKKSESSPPQTDTPEVQQLFKKKSCPDLEAVNRALEALRLKNPDSNDPYLIHLATLAVQLDKAKTDCKKLLKEAMAKREEDKREICRGLCIQIIHNQGAEVETRVYAYNILSTLASPGQAMNFLKEAEKLIKEDGKEDRLQLLGTVFTLMERAKANGDKVAKKSGNDENESAGLTLTMPPTVQRSAPATPSSLLGLPEGGSGTITPRTEKILGWFR